MFSRPLVATATSLCPTMPLHFEERKSGIHGVTSPKSSHGFAGVKCRYGPILTPISPSSKFMQVMNFLLQECLALPTEGSTPNCIL